MELQEPSDPSQWPNRDIPIVRCSFGEPVRAPLRIVLQTVKDLSGRKFSRAAP